MKKNNFERIQRFDKESVKSCLFHDLTLLTSSEKRCIFMKCEPVCLASTDRLSFFIVDAK